MQYTMLKFPSKLIYHNIVVLHPVCGPLPLFKPPHRHQITNVINHNNLKMTAHFNENVTLDT